jgi:hypothetical protein
VNANRGNGSAGFDEEFERAWPVRESMREPGVRDAGNGGSRCAGASPTSSKANDGSKPRGIVIVNLYRIIVARLSSSARIGG